MNKVIIALLSVVRIVALLVAIWQVVGLLPALSYFSNFESVSGGILVVVGIKVLALIVGLLIFFGLGRVNQRIRAKRELRTQSTG